MTRGCARVALLVMLFVALPAPLVAQAATLKPEVRVDVLGPRPYVWQPGVGVTRAMGYYARVSAIVGYAPRADERLLGDRWRADVIARVLLDPFREQRWAVSFGGGLSFRRETYLAGVLDIEGPAIRGMLPALEVGVSGGVRAGIMLRRAAAGRR